MWSLALVAIVVLVAFLVGFFLGVNEGEHIERTNRELDDGDS